MEYLVAIIFGLLGCGIGFFIPRVSNYIIEFKLTQRQRQKESNFLDQRKWVILMTIINGFFWATVGYFAPNVFAGIIIGCLITLAIMFTIIDMIIHIIPNEMLLIGAPLAILFQIIVFGFEDIWIAFACMAGIMFLFTVLGLIFGLNKIGAGDVKLAGLMGLALGYPLILYALMIMSIALLIFSFIGLSTGKLTHVTMFAFAPFLMLGLVIGLGLVLFPEVITLIQSIG